MKFLAVAKNKQIPLIIYLLVAVQLIDGIRRPSLEMFTQSYWVLSYDEGFVRRGLGGELIQLLTGPNSEAKVYFVAWSITLIAAAAIIWLISRLLRYNTATSYVLAAILAASPFALDFITQVRGPELIGIPLLVAAAIRPTITIGWKGIVLGLILAITIFFHEIMAVIFLPWFAIIAIMSAIQQTQSTKLGSIGIKAFPMIAPSIFAALAVAFFGVANVNDESIAALKEAQPWFKPGDSPTVFDWLDVSLKEDISLVINAIDLDNLITIVFSGFVFFSTFAGIRLATKAHLMTQIRVFVPGTFLLISLLMIFLSALTIYTTGHDWARWSAEIWLMSAITVSGSYIAYSKRPTNHTQLVSQQIKVLIPALCFFTAMPPINWTEDLQHVIYIFSRATLIGAVLFIFLYILIIATSVRGQAE